MEDNPELLHGARVIYSCGIQRWRIRIPTGRNAAGKPSHHSKVIHGSKRDAQAYLGWVTALLTAGPVITVSQSDLRALQVLQGKADQLRQRLERAVRAGAKVEPGELELPIRNSLVVADCHESENLDQVSVLPSKREPDVIRTGAA